MKNFKKEEYGQNPMTEKLENYPSHGGSHKPMTSEHQPHHHNNNCIHNDEHKRHHTNDQSDDSITKACYKCHGKNGNGCNDCHGKDTDDDNCKPCQ